MEVEIKLKTPCWAMPMIRNYRAAFKVKYGYESVLGDEQVFTICELVYNDGSIQAQDDDRLAEMKVQDDHTLSRRI